MAQSKTATAIDYLSSSIDDTSESMITIFGKSSFEKKMELVKKEENFERHNSSRYSSKNADSYIADNVEEIFSSAPIKAIESKESRIITSSGRSTPIEKWEGIVTDVDLENGKFYGELRDILKYDDRIMSGEFDFDDVEESKRNLIKENSVFYWNIYDETSPGAPLRRGINSVYFRETLPIWKNFNFNDVSTEIKDIHKSIFDDNATTK